MPAIESSAWFGPIGGLLCVAFAMGCVAGWSFAMKLMKERLEEMKSDMNRERDDCNRRITLLETRVKDVEDLYMHGMERQLGQVRQSTVSILRRPDDAT